MKTVAPTGVYTPDIFGPGVLTAYSGREFSNENRHEFLKAIGVSDSRLILLKQIHSANLVLVKPDQKPASDCQADGMLTAEPGVCLGVLTADCVPVFFWDPDRRVAAIAHAGWRGMLQRIVAKTLQAMRQNFGSKSSSIRVAVGPAIRSCCYEVGEEFGEMFRNHYLARVPDSSKGSMDLIGELADQLADEGVSKDQFSDTGICTSCQNQNFFSYRREKGTEHRILSVIQIRE